MTPEEIQHRSDRSTEPQAIEDQETTKESIEAIRLQAAENLLTYQEETRRWKNKKVKPRSIQHGDLVLRRKPNANMVGKLNSKWEGPFVAIQTPRPEAFRLQTIEGEEDLHTWPLQLLQKYYI